MPVASVAVAGHFGDISASGDVRGRDSLRGSEDIAYSSGEWYREGCGGVFYECRPERFQFPERFQLQGERMIKTIHPARFSKTILVPASKSHTIRALFIASFAEGTSRVLNPLDSEDTASCLRVCRLFGARITEGKTSGGERILIVEGNRGCPAPPGLPVDVGNSGTTLYFASALAALAGAEVSFTGDGQICSRPSENLLRSLEDLGAKVSCEAGGRAPFTVRGPLRGGKTSIECPTSQYLSALLLAAPLISPPGPIGPSELPEGRACTEIDVPLLYEEPYVEMTLRWLEDQGIRLERQGLRHFVIPGGQRYHAFEKAVPGDFSSATFFFCAAAVSGGPVTLRGLDMGDAQGDKAVISILKSMGCAVKTAGTSITLTGASLKGRDIDMNAIPDALPALAATACFAGGKTRLLNVPQARLKETDRIAVMASELSKMGARIRELPDGLEIEGGADLRGCRVDGHADHRVVMALAIAALSARGTTEIEGAEAVAVTFP
ncbi:MAG: 3-phosphoshikimate 1-carboxyvinyltransferase, partial [Spirochaetales bacterium]|nr:3-phosphoshikimate 1-carboxyvinyltransferase [Spirochaetales bacterium]